MKKLLSILLSMCLIFSMVACGNQTNNNDEQNNPGNSDDPSGGNNSAEGDPIYIGCIYPKSGTSAYDGENKAFGAQAAAQYINDNGGILGGRRIELIIEDSATDPDVSASAAEKLINSDHVVALLGAFNSSSTAAVMPVAEEYQIPLITGVATSATLTEEGNEWFFRAVGISKLYIGSFAETVINEVGGKNIAYIYENGDWGLGSVEAFKECAEGLGATTLTTQVVNSTDADLYTQLTAIKNTNPDVIYAVSNLANAVRIATQARELGIECPIVGEGAWATADFLEQAGDAAEGIYGFVEYLPDIESELNPAFTELYGEVSGGKIPDKYAASGFDTVLIIADAIERAGSTDPEAIRQALTETDMTIIQGNIKFDEKGQGYGFETYLSKNENGVAICAGSATVMPEE